MKAVILAGGYGTRISEESRPRPKPMVEVGGMPILWHIMKVYSAQGVDDFVVCAGYKQHMVKEWFADYFLHTADVTFDYTGGELATVAPGVEPIFGDVPFTGVDMPPEAFDTNSCLRLPSDSASRRTPLPSAARFPLPGAPGTFTR